MIIRCSSLARAMTCRGSLFFKDLEIADTDKTAADEGTAAGEHLERLLTGQTIGTHAKNGVAFDVDMKFHTEILAKEILSLSGTDILCETRIDWTTRSGIQIRGQYDASFSTRHHSDTDPAVENTLYVDDLKYGWNLVEVKENWQLLGYAIGEVLRRNESFDKIILRIHQPRPHHEDGPTREWILTYPELLEYKEQIEVQMMKIVDGNSELETGPQCKYCPAGPAACPAFNKSLFRGIEVVHQFLQDDISDDELSFQLDLMTRVSEVMKIKKRSIEDLAVHRIKSGKLIPNYVTKEKLSDRAWRAGIGPEVIKMITGKDITRTTTLSPAQAEKLGVPVKLVATMTQRHSKGRKLKRVDTSKRGEEIFGTQNAK